LNEFIKLISGRWEGYESLLKHFVLGWFFGMVPQYIKCNLVVDASLRLDFLVFVNGLDESLSVDVFD
jgi:hypothetical protein